MERNIFNLTETSKPAASKPKGLALPNAVTETLARPDIITKHNIRGMVKDATQEAAYEHCRALLTKSVLDNVTALSLLEAHLSSTIPNARARLMTIVDVYTIAAGEKIRGF